jgi:hypothetical protein
MVKMSIRNSSEHLFHILGFDADTVRYSVCFLPANGLINNEEITDFATNAGGVKKGLVARHH